MENIFLKAHAKINLNLHLLPDLSDEGYFPVRFINSQLNIYDRIKIEKTDKNTVDINMVLGKNIDTSILDTNIQADSNLAYRAAELIRKDFNIASGVNIEIKKNIPIKAGLGGGSCDAAGVINGMDALFNLKLTPRQKVKLGEKLGMDVCYCVIGGVCLVGGIGNIVIPLPYSMPKIDNVLLVIPKVQKPSTAWAYSVIENKYIGQRLDNLNALLAGILKNDIELICKSIWNDFEKPISKHFPIVEEAIELLKNKGACAATLAGSGLTVFGIFKEKDKMENAKIDLKKMGCRCLQTAII